MSFTELYRFIVVFNRFFLLFHLTKRFHLKFYRNFTEFYSLKSVVTVSVTSFYWWQANFNW